MRRPRRAAALRVAALAAGLLAAGAAAGALEYPEHIAGIALREVRWQALPDQVCRVFAGPDGRAWYELAHPSAREDLAAVRRIIEREFKEPAPQLFGASPALFEPGGRVWFVTHSGTTLLGYDGREWIERTPGKDRYFPGVCPNHGRREQHDRLACNRQLGGRAFFPDSHGVHCFDGREWSYQQLRPDDDQELRYPLLVPEPGGGLAAVLRGERPGLWFWREGRWAPRELQPALGGKDRALAGILPVDRDGCWLFTGQGPAYLAYADRSDPEVARWLAALADDDYRLRDEAGRALVALGAGILPQLAKARSRVRDPEVLERLAKVVEELSDPARTTIRLGPYRLREAVYLDTADDGAGFVWAARAREGGKDLGPGMVVHNGRGEFRFVAGRNFDKLWHWRNSIHSGVLVARAGQRWWIPGDITAEPARLLDFETGRFADALPENRFFWLHCAFEDGRVFAGPDVPSAEACPVMVYRPGAPDDRRLLRGTSVALKGETFCVAADGSVWAEAVEPEGIVRFDGKAWKAVEALAGVAKVREFLPGRDGWMLLRTDAGFSLAGPGGCWSDRELKSLVTARRKEFAAAFAAGPRPEGDCPWGGRVSLAADAAGNIWFLSSRLEVLTARGWLDAGKALVAAGSRVEDPVYMAPVGDGSRVYVSDMMSAHSRGRSFLAGLGADGPAFAKAPHTSERAPMCPPVYDRQGALWVNSNQAVAMGTCDLITGQAACRVTEKGAAGEFANQGWARLCDRSGNVWLGAMRGEGRTRFNIWRDGRLAGSVSVPSAGGDSQLLADRPGSVFVLTCRGLHHLAAEPDRPAQFAEKARYTLDGLRGLLGRAAVTGHGQLAAAVSVLRADGEYGCDLYLFPLPND